MKRRWLVFVGLAVPAFGALSVLATVELVGGVAGHPENLVIAATVDLILGGLIVVPGAMWLARVLRGKPELRIEARGIVWGNDRADDVWIDWSDVERLTVRVVESQGLTDRVVIVEPRAQWRFPSGKSIHRFVAAVNRALYGGSLAISTLTLAMPFDELVAVLERRSGVPVTVPPGDRRQP